MVDNNEEITVEKNGEKIVLTENRIRELTSRFIEKCGNQATTYNDFGMNSKMVELLIDVKKAWFPETQKHLNMNVNSFDNQLKRWMEARKEMKEAQEENNSSGVQIIQNGQQANS